MSPQSPPSDSPGDDETDRHTSDSDTSGSGASERNASRRDAPRNPPRSNAPDRDSSRRDVPANDTFDGLLPDAGVDSRWWYWIAATPLYALASMLFGIFAFFAAFLGMVADIELTIIVFPLLFVFVLLPALVLTFLFPIAIYVDAKAVARADLGWNPDPVLYGLIALAGVILTGFTVSVLLALYYLYQRHKFVGTP